MAFIMEIETAHGLTMSLFWRFNSFDQYPNRDPTGVVSVPAIARFHGYASAEACKAGKAFVEEALVTYTHTPTANDPIAEAYAAFKAQDHTAIPRARLIEAQTTLADLKRAVPYIAAAEAEIATAKEQPPSDELTTTIGRLETRLATMKDAAATALAEAGQADQAVADATAALAAAQQRQDRLAAATPA